MDKPQTKVLSGALFISMRDVNVYLLQDVDSLELHHEEVNSFIKNVDDRYERVEEASLKIDVTDVERAAFALLSRHSVKAMYFIDKNGEAYVVSLSGLKVKATKIKLV